MRHLPCSFGGIMTVPLLSPEVQRVPGDEGPVPRGPDEDNPGGAAVEQSHGAQVARLLSQIHRAASAEVTRAWW